MIYVAAFKTAKVTGSGCAVYSVDFDDYSREPARGYYPVAELKEFCAGDDGWANVLDENHDIVILNADGQIDIDREIYQQRTAAVIAARKEDDEDDVYKYD
jgi:hypothetical protein